MPQTRSRFFDDLSKLMTDAAGLADGARREVDTAVRSQFERLLAGMDVVRREEFEAVREMAALARAENDRLRERVAALESFDGAPASSGAPERERLDGQRHEEERDRIERGLGILHPGSLDRRLENVARKG